MNKITPEHLSRGAIVYIRQSSPGQVANNLESKRRQYALADRARQVGWREASHSRSSRLLRLYGIDRRLGTHRPAIK
jgi:DNA invertase Pin-like site-specific DNA recombinase